MSEQSDAVEWNGLRFSSADQSSLWIHMVKKGHVRLGTKADFEARNSTIAEIAGRVKRGSFAPHNLGFLCAAKGNGVPRFIPVLDVETTCVFYALFVPSMKNAPPLLYLALTEVGPWEENDVRWSKRRFSEP